EHGTGWSAMILPQLEQGNVYDTLLWTGRWTLGDANTRACATLIPPYLCPSMTVPKHIDNNSIPQRVPTSYGGCASSTVLTDVSASAQRGPALRDGPQNGIFFADSRVDIAQI